jgi:hypothetical protein
MRKISLILSVVFVMCHGRRIVERVSSPFMGRKWKEREIS